MGTVTTNAVRSIADVLDCNLVCLPQSKLRLRMYVCMYANRTSLTQEVADRGERVTLSQSAATQRFREPRAGGFLTHGVGGVKARLLSD